MTRFAIQAAGLQPTGKVKFAHDAFVCAISSAARSLTVPLVHFLGAAMNTAYKHATYNEALCL